MMQGKTKKLILAGLFAALTAVGAFLRIPLGAMSLTLQFLFTAYAGLLLGSSWGAASQAVYVALGLVGLPVFTMGGGLSYVFQPSFGCLLGLIPAAWVIGRLAGKEGNVLRVFAACAAGLAVLYLIGIPYLYMILNLYLQKGLSWGAVLRTGMLIYLPGDFLKIFVVSITARPLLHVLRFSR